MTSELARHWTLNPEVTFLNHGSFGAVPRAVLEHQTELRARLERDPVRFFVRELAELWSTARERGAEFVGADPDGFVFVPNATTGVNTALRAVGASEGDELLVTNQEYNACRNALNDLGARAGAEVRVVDLPLPVRSTEQVVEAVTDALTAKTRLLLIDHVVSQTGLVMPIREIARECRERGVVTIIDGAHAPGMIDLDLTTLGVDFYTGNFHKWVCTPKSAALLWVAEDWRQRTSPLVVSHGANMPAETAVERLHNEFDWQGTIDPTPMLSIPFGIDHMASLVEGGWPEIRRRNHDLALAARELLADALDTELLAPAEMIGALAAVRLPAGDPAPQASPLYLDPVQDELLFEHHIEVPIIPFPGPPERLIRVSAQLYNSIEDYERLVEVLPAVFQN